MGVDHVEGVVGELQRVHIGGAELDVFQAAFGGDLRRRLHHARRRFDGGHPAGGDQLGQVGGDGARPAADVQEPRSRTQMAEQIRRGVLRGAPAVRAQYRFIVSVGVRGHTRLSPRPARPGAVGSRPMDTGTGPRRRHPSPRSRAGDTASPGRRGAAVTVMDDFRMRLGIWESHLVVWTTVVAAEGRQPFLPRV